jgi:hypothetical protein
MSTRRVFCASLALFVLVGLFPQVQTTAHAQEELSMREWNNRIRREKFDTVLPVAMRKNNVDMWIHVMRIAIYLRCLCLHGPWR